MKDHALLFRGEYFRASFFKPRGQSSLATKVTISLLSCEIALGVWCRGTAKNSHFHSLLTWLFLNFSHLVSRKRAFGLLLLAGLEAPIALWVGEPGCVYATCNFSSHKMLAHFLYPTTMAIREQYVPLRKRPKVVLFPPRICLFDLHHYLPFSWLESTGVVPWDMAKNVVYNVLHVHASYSAFRR